MQILADGAIVAGEIVQMSVEEQSRGQLEDVDRHLPESSLGLLHCRSSSILLYSRQYHEVSESPSSSDHIILVEMKFITFI